MRDYEIRYLHDDGALSLVYKTACPDDVSARRLAQQMLPSNCARFEIWSDSARLSDAPALYSAA